MKKIIFIIVIIFMCVGCEATYNLRINDDLSIEETINAYQKNNFFDKFTGFSREDIINRYSLYYKEYMDKANYDQKIVEYETKSGMIIKKKYSTLNKFFTNSIVYRQYYKTFNHSLEDGILTIELKDKYPYNRDSTSRYMIDKGEINIQSAFKVIDSNADSYDKMTNTYTWNINSKNNKNINITIDTTKKQFLLGTLINYIIIFASIFVLIIIVYFIIKKKKTKDSF